jgi:N6-adenosine-specific RNA methylase IME4
MTDLLLPGGHFDIILADPPWRFKTRSEKGRSRSPDGPLGHYQTMSSQDIAAMPVGALSNRDAVLYLWTTVPFLEISLGVANAWGFAYKSSMVWVKERIGTGYWARNRHEIVLICKRGRFPAPAPAFRPDSVIEGQQRKHSHKPDALQEIIEAAWPNASKIELFARNYRPGWTAWGNQLAVKSSAPETIAQNERLIR